MLIDLLSVVSSNVEADNETIVMLHLSNSTASQVKGKQSTTFIFCTDTLFLIHSVSLSIASRKYTTHKLHNLRVAVLYFSSTFVNCYKSPHKD